MLSASSYCLKSHAPNQRISSHTCILQSAILSLLFLSLLHQNEWARECDTETVALSHWRIAPTPRFVNHLSVRHEFSPPINMFPRACIQPFRRRAQPHACAPLCSRRLPIHALSLVHFFLAPLFWCFNTRTTCAFWNLLFVVSSFLAPP